MTAGLTASATVMALSVALGASPPGDGASIGSPYGDSRVLDADADHGSEPGDA